MRRTRIIRLIDDDDASGLDSLECDSSLASSSTTDLECAETGRSSELLLEPLLEERLRLLAEDAVLGEPSRGVRSLLLVRW